MPGRQPTSEADAPCLDVFTVVAPQGEGYEPIGCLGLKLTVNAKARRRPLYVSPSKKVGEDAVRLSVPGILLGHHPRQTSQSPGRCHPVRPRGPSPEGCPSPPTVDEVGNVCPNAELQ